MPKKLYTIFTAVLGIVLSVSLYLGSIPPSPLYYLRLTREEIQTFFIFGDEDQANWLLTREDKRLTEALKLKQKKLAFFEGKQLDLAKNYQSEAELLLVRLKDKTNINYLIDKLNQNKDKVKSLEGS